MGTQSNWVSFIPVHVLYLFCQKYESNNFKKASEVLIYYVQVC